MRRPSQHRLQAVVTPEQLRADDERGGAENARGHGPFGPGAEPRLAGGRLGLLEPLRARQVQRAQTVLQHHRSGDVPVLSEVGPEYGPHEVGQPRLRRKPAGDSRRQDAGVGTLAGAAERQFEIGADALQVSPHRPPLNRKQVER